MFVSCSWAVWVMPGVHIQSPSPVFACFWFSALNYISLIGFRTYFTDIWKKYNFKTWSSVFVQWLKKINILKLKCMNEWMLFFIIFWSMPTSCGNMMSKWSNYLSSIFHGILLASCSENKSWSWFNYFLKFVSFVFYYVLALGRERKGQQMGVERGLLSYLRLQ